VNDIQSKEYYPEGMINLKMPSFGGHKAGRSIVKTCLALAVESGVNPRICEVARSYLLNGGEACFGYYYERDLIKNRPEGVIFHCVSIEGNPDTKLLLGYVEYYSAQRMIICLSNEYEGEKFSRTYALNPMSGNEIELIINLSSLNQEDIVATYKYEKIPKGSIEEAFSKIIPIGIELSFQKELERVLNKGMQYAFENCGAKEGENLTEEQIAKLPSLLMEKLKPFIIHQLRRPKC
jgi:hypothetical protein